MMTSLRHQLFGLCLLMAAASMVVSILLYGLTRHSEKVQVAQTRQMLAQACDRIQSRFVQATQTTPIDQRAALQGAVLQLVLDDYQGVEGGIWDSTRGVVAYAYPTYQGSGIKNDVPPAELPNIQRAAQQSAHWQTPSDYARANDREILLLTACPLSKAQSAWVMTRVHTEGEVFYRRLTLGLAILFGVVLFCVIAVAWVLNRWDQKLTGIEDALVVADPAAAEPLAPMGSDELDRLGQAINRYARRSVEARQEANELAKALARGARLADIGRMVATVAHEIRNPIATMRLTAENALAARETDTQAMDRLLIQIDRLDGVVESLLTMAQPIKLDLKDVELLPWAQAITERFHQGGSPIRIEADAVSAQPAWRMDPHYMERAVDNLLRNAQEHTRNDQTILFSITPAIDKLKMVVSNPGEPIPDEFIHRLFEPFATGRVHGNGLGLALVREIALAHGGDVTYSHADGLTLFTLELPWRAS